MKTEVNERIETKYNKIVNFDKETGEITVLDETFEYKYLGGFKGATGTVFQIVSKEEFYDTINPYLNDDKKLLVYMAENFGELPADVIRNVDSSEDGLREMFFDLSYEHLWDYLREELGLTEDEAFLFDCIGGGRCFSEDYQGNYNKELSFVIREFESNL